MPLFALTYEVVTPESAEAGEVADYGLLEPTRSLREAFDRVHATRTNRVEGVQSIECDSRPCDAPRWVTVINGVEFETGAQESRSLHLPPHLTPATRRRITRLVGACV